MPDASELTVVYAVTPDSRFRLMAASSIYSLLRHNPGIPVMIAEAPGGDYPLGIKHHALRLPVSTPWALFIDADTKVTGSLSRLFNPQAGCQFRGRHETMWTLGRIEHKNWVRVCELAGVPPVAIYNSGAFLIRAALLQHVADCWAYWMDWLPKNVGDPLCRKEAAKRYEWWMLDQCALSLAVADLRRDNWTAKEHSYQWNKEVAGVIHHYGSKRWKDILCEPC